MGKSRSVQDKRIFNYINTAASKFHSSGLPSGSSCTEYFANDTNVTTIRSKMLIPAGSISRNARRERDTMPSFARR